MLHGPGKLFRRSILEEVAGRTGMNGGTDDNRIKMHAERQNGGLRGVRADTPDQSKTTQILALQPEINDNDVGLVLQKRLVARQGVACIQDGGGSVLLEEPATRSDDDRVVVDEKDFAHWVTGVANSHQRTRFLYRVPRLLRSQVEANSGLDYCNWAVSRYRENVPIVPGQIPVAAIRASH